MALLVLLLNDKKEGEDHWNFAYVPWFYSGAPDGQPVLEPTSDGKFYLPMFMHMMMHLYGGSASLIVATIQGIWN